MTLSASRLERDPWRLVWRCGACSNASTVRVSTDALTFLEGLLRPYGLVVGAFEADAFERATVADLALAVELELR